MTNGILALQGAFHEHKKMLLEMGIKSFFIRQVNDISKTMDGLIIPGGESTVISKLLHELHLFNPLKDLIEKGLPVFGTCAGLIVLSKNTNNNENSYFATMEIESVRNAYGRQLGSFITYSPFNGDIIKMIFIRAPYIKTLGKDVHILSKVDDKIVAARQGNQLVTAFHPELTNDTSVHEYFIDIVKQFKKENS